jgi:guanylate kinase
MSPFQGKLIIVAGPSGSGKTTIVHHLIKLMPELSFSVSACSRPPRQGERDGIDYHFLSAQEFKKRIAHREFIEWEEVYPGNYYGTLRSEVEQIWKKEKHVIFDIDVVGALNLKKLYPVRALTIFVQPPSLPVLEERLKSRNTEKEVTLATRLEKASKELEFAPRFDKIIKNESLDTAVNEAVEAVQKFISKE